MMRGSIRKRPPSEGEYNSLAMVSVKPSLSDGDGLPPSKEKKNKDVHVPAPAQEDFNAKGPREEPFPVSSFISEKKRSWKNQSKYGIDSEELQALTYPKQISAPVESANQTLAEGSGRRSNQKKRTRAERVSDTTKKWSGDEEISLSMALLECLSPDGKINKLAFYQRARESLRDEVSNIQLHDKMRTMKNKFKTIQAKLKEQNFAEDNFLFRTHHEAALFKIWNRIWGYCGDNRGNHSETLKENGVQNVNEFENSRVNVVKIPKEIENENPRGNRGKSTENSMKIKCENPGKYEAQTPRERGAEIHIANDKGRQKSGETEGENPRGVEGEKTGDIGSENPIKIDVTKPRGSGVEKEKEGKGQNLQFSGSHEKGGEEQNLQTSVSHETQNIEENRVCNLRQSRSGHSEDNIKILLERTESRLQASIENSINRVSVASAAGAIFRSFGGFGPETEMEVFLSRKMKELMDGFNSVKGFPGLDSVEARELQQKRRALKIQEVRMFSECLDLLQKQCTLFLKNAESSSFTD